jgi:hypothetical protein
MGVLRCPVGVFALIAGWKGTAMSERTSLTMEKSADAVVPAGSLVAGKG